MSSNKRSHTCKLCGKSFPATELIPIAMLRETISQMILNGESTASPSSGDYICLNDLNQIRLQYLQKLIEEDRGELSALEQDVFQSMKEYDIISRNVETEFNKKLTLGERISDQVATFGGSWWFISLFTVTLLVWITLNSIGLMAHPFDPYPYILLNLVLSCLAALQAPIIMMSQNRQEAKDRLRSEYDYRVNLKAEMEIRQLNQKMDMLLSHQWQRLLEIQQLQMDVLNELIGKKKSS